MLIPGSTSDFFFNTPIQKAPIFQSCELVCIAKFLQFLIGVFFGAIFILLLYNQFIYFSVKDVSYLYYVGYLGAVTLFQLVEIGHGAIHSGWLFEWEAKEWLPVVIWAAFWFGILFVKEYLNLKEDHPRINNLFTLLLRIVVVSLMLSIFKRETISIVWVSSFAVIILLAILWSGFYVWLSGNDNARLFCLAWVCNVFGFLIYSLMAQGIIPATTLTLLSAPLGILLEAIMLSFALADRIKIERRKALVADLDSVNNLSQYRSIFDNSLEGMYQMTVSGKIKAANISMSRMMGCSSISQLLNGKHKAFENVFDNDEGNYKALIDCGEIRNEALLIRDGIPSIWIIHKAKLIYDNLGDAQYIEGTVADITDDKEKEVAIKEALKERLRKEYASVEAYQKGRFLAMMSHQIRTPLTSIIGFSELMQERSMALDEKRECVDLVVENSGALLQLINNILDYSKMEAGKFDVECIVVNVMDTIKILSDSFLEKANDKSLKFDTKIIYPIPDRIQGDPTRILQVVNNLCSNAIRYTEKGSVTLGVSWVNDKLMFSVSDTGVGIELEKVREFSAGSLMENGGSLGLPISKILAKMMGGDIVVSRNDRQGSVFEFTTQGKLFDDTCWINSPNEKECIGTDVAEIGLTTKTQKARISRSKKGGSLPSLSGRVLLAEDNVVNQKLIERVLRKTGVDVVVASDGVEACEYCNKEAFDFVLMDINMPNRNGIEATEHLRKNQYRMPIYALTAETDQSEIDRILDVGCEGYLSKPLNKALLYEVMEGILPQKLSE